MSVTLGGGSFPWRSARNGDWSEVNDVVMPPSRFD